MPCGTGWLPTPEVSWKFFHWLQWTLDQAKGSERFGYFCDCQEHLEFS